MKESRGRIDTGASSRAQCGTTTLNSFHDSFYLSHLSRDPRLASVCVGAEWNSVGVIYCSRGARVECAASRRLVEFAIKKIDAMEGISPEANLLLFHFVRSSSFIRYSLESTLFHRQSDTVRVAFRCERETRRRTRSWKCISNVDLFLLSLLCRKDTERNLLYLLVSKIFIIFQQIFVNNSIYVVSRIFHIVFSLFFYISVTYFISSTKRIYHITLFYLSNV